jgi:hypothetical protein
MARSTLSLRSSSMCHLLEHPAAGALALRFAECQSLRQSTGAAAGVPVSATRASLTPPGHAPRCQRAATPPGEHHAPIGGTGGSTSPAPTTRASCSSPAGEVSPRRQPAGEPKLSITPAQLAGRPGPAAPGPAPAAALRQPVGVSSGCLTFHTAHRRRGSVRPARAPPVRAGPVPQVVPATGVLRRRPVGDLVPAQPACAQQVVSKHVLVGEVVVGWRRNLAASHAAGERRTRLDGKCVRAHMVGP